MLNIAVETPVTELYPRLLISLDVKIANTIQSRSGKPIEMDSYQIERYFEKYVNRIGRKALRGRKQEGMYSTLGADCYVSEHLEDNVALVNILVDRPSHMPVKDFINLLLSELKNSELKVCAAEFGVKTAHGDTGYYRLHSEYTFLKDNE